MFNKRWKKVLVWSLSVVLVIVIGGLFAANYAVDKFMSSMAGGLDLEQDNTSDSESVVIEPTVEPTTEPANTATIGKSDIEKIVPSASSVTNEVNKPISSPNTSRESVKAATPATTAQPASTPSSEKVTGTEGYTAQVSTDKAKQIQENVTVKEKADVASIVMGQLSVSDIKRLQELASGGLTIEEKREARRIILDNVSADQYNELSSIAKKYGVSEGKTQEQVIAEEKAVEEGSE
ncbi:hypothetical protein P40081_30600 [Paenibacillus sp. FSL P4-0081]|uniref:hypothetical protein n=1 Tax=Paenibacillus sp. FSL P4-0081 TaxID=1536769 RepID=UPI0004F92213|nr:hypothetical protein [Paenibacillus sp. FSL P4-0081]AIQ31991.1 hypothetical protein P40081_30600 [Paenibacillus sp. FSL P4-0081]